jgi:transcriptional regulator with XRE-family HTH domain
MRYQARDPEVLRELVATPVRLVPHTQRSLAELVGTSKSTIGYLISGERDSFTEDVARGVAEAYGKPLDELFVPAPSSSTDGEKEAS